jgi:hypothetical protein
MSFHFNSYEHTVARHEQLMAEAEIERKLAEGRSDRPGPLTRLRVGLGKILISAGESLARTAQAPGRA